MRMLTSQFNYHLPRALIAQKPIKPRDRARLLILDKKSGAIAHRHFYNLGDYLARGDVLVLNNSKVIPARLIGQKETGGKVEIFLLNKISSRTWAVLVKGKIKPGQKVDLPKNIEAIITNKTNDFSPPFQGGDRGGLPENSKKSANHPNPSFRQRSDAVERRGNEQIIWQVKFNCGDQKLFTIGQTPTPPYIKPKAKLVDYQTIYAKEKGSVAAPTAGLHFTKKLLTALKKKGIKIEYLTLHVGLGTFAPVKTARIEDHQIHRELAAIDQKTAARINAAKKAGHKIIACGTTTVRTLEALSSFPPPSQGGREATGRSDPERSEGESRQMRPWEHLALPRNGREGVLSAGKKWVDIFIYPGYKFKIVDEIITNFHLPKSTLLMLVSAFAQASADKPAFACLRRQAGRQKIMKAYREAISKKYRFYSFGDAMLIK